MKFFIPLMMVLTILSASFLSGCGSKDPNEESAGPKTPYTGDKAKAPNAATPQMAK